MNVNFNSIGKEFAAGVGNGIAGRLGSLQDILQLRSLPLKDFLLELFIALRGWLVVVPLTLGLLTLPAAFFTPLASLAFFAIALGLFSFYGVLKGKKGAYAVGLALGAAAVFGALPLLAGLSLYTALAIGFLALDFDVIVEKAVRV